jgi:hypothetical protein
MDDQRASLLPVPNHHTSSTRRPKSASTSITTSTQLFLNQSISKTLPDEEFFSLLNRLQSRHTDQQRILLSPKTKVPSKRAHIKS